MRLAFESMVTVVSLNVEPSERLPVAVTVTAGELDTVTVLVSSNVESSERLPVAATALLLTFVRLLPSADSSSDVTVSEDAEY